MFWQIQNQDLSDFIAHLDLKATVDTLAEAILAGFIDLAEGKTEPLDMGDLSWKEIGDKDI